MESPAPQSFDRVLSSMCTEPHPAAREAAERFLATNPGDPGTFPAVAELEERVVDRLGEVVGLSDPNGYVASGGTEANVQAVRAARNLGDADDPVVVAPESAHYSFEKAAELCDVRLRRVPTDEDGRADVDATAAAVDDETVLVVAVAGSTEYGRVDPVPALADLAADAGALCHVDAAWGGFYLPFTDHEWNFDDADVDTMTVDPHKAGQAAVPAGGFLAEDPAVLDALAVETPYLERDAQASLSGTRSGAGVASAAAALEALWPEGYRAASDTQQAHAERLAGAFGDRGYDVVEPSLPLVAVDLPVATFEALRDRGWRLARTAAGETRIVCMPHLDDDAVDAFLRALDECRGRVSVAPAEDG